MIKVTDGRIGTREFCAIILLTIGMKVTDTTPSLFYEEGANAAWITPFFYLVTIGVPFLLLLSLMKKHDKGLVELLSHLAGKLFGSFLIFLLALMVFFSMTFSSRSYITITNTLFYPKMSIFLLTFLFLITSFFVAKRGLTAISSAAWLLTPVFQISLVVLILLVLNHMHWYSIFPIAGLGLGKMMKQSVTHSALFGDIIVLAAFFPFVRSFTHYRFASLLGFGISIFTMSLFLVIYVVVFDYPSTFLMAYPHQELTRIASFSETMSHVEGAFFIFWLMGSVFRFAIYLYLTAFLFGGAFRFDKFEKLLLPITGLVMLVGLLPANMFLIDPYRDLFFKFSSVVFISLPFLLWLLDKLKGGKSNNEEPENPSC